MKNLIKNESGITGGILDTLLSIVFIIVGFFIGVAVIYKIGDVLILIGGRGDDYYLYRHMFLVGIIIFIIAAFVILLAKVYRKTHDTGKMDEVYTGFK